ncbi:MAG: HEAT repeat domain-containing protein [Leptolyngbyaceae bacterium]|nr:HEAT repeat domain-containing protein [Leptolyngbyaceae bacterium]
MDQRFNNLFNLTEAEAIALLDTPQAQITDGDSRYVAASHLINFATDAAINALIRAVQRTDDDSLENRIARRKSVESLGKLRAPQALPAICQCLQEEDHLTVENAVWAIGEIGTDDPEVLEAVAQQLSRQGQNHRIVIHTLAKLNYRAALERIRPFMDAEDAPVASAAIAAVCRFTQDMTPMQQVEAFLFHPMVIVRRLAVQDLIDAQYTPAIPEIANAPISIAFRLRGLRLLAKAGQVDGVTFDFIQPYLEKTLRDHPDGLDLVHKYDELPALSFLIRELYGTDFGRCYLAVKTILNYYAAEAPAALFATYEEEANRDYGAHFHVVKLFGWLKHQPAYDLLITALHNRAPQFQKSRAAAAIALAELGHPRAIPELQQCLESNVWDLQYASLMALEALGDTSRHPLLVEHADWLLQQRARYGLQHGL